MRNHVVWNCVGETIFIQPIIPLKRFWTGETVHLQTHRFRVEEALLTHAGSRLVAVHDVNPRAGGMIPGKN